MARGSSTRKKKARAKRKRRPPPDRAWIRRVLYSEKVGRPPKYRPDFHPEDIVAFFQDALDAIEARPSGS